jgi:signal transduction histidine kinase
MLIFDGKGELLYPVRLEDGFVTQSLADQISKKLNKEDRGTVQTIQADGKGYIFTYERLLKAEIDRNPNIVFVSSLNSANGLIFFINFTLILIMLFGIFVSAFVTILLSNSISRKMNALCKVANRIGFNEYQFKYENSGIQEIDELSKSISDMSKRLSAYDKAQKAFLQNASHEIRTPLMSIQGYAEGIENGVMTDTKKAAAIISSESKRLNVLVEELLTLSRIENQTYNDLAVVSLNDCLKDYVQRLDGLTIQQGKKIQLELPEKNISARVNDTLLYHAVMNITANCIRYAKTMVRIELSEDNKKAVIRISDDGDGISEQDLPYIFNRFYKGKSGKFGLGLSIAKASVELMGGGIIAYNNKGAVFKITLQKETT